MQYSQDFFGPTGPLSTLSGYEHRAGQQDMSNGIYDVLSRGHIALVEAGTGTGKSLAYLYPAICHAKQRKEKVVISTNTINLQEQLLDKDIPVLKKLGVEFKAAVVKGWANYPCWLRIQEMIENPLEQGKPRFEKIIEKLEAGKIKSRSDIPVIDGVIWDEIQAESDLCLRGRCSFFQDCPVFISRRQAEQAELVIVNHHLLLADINVRQEKGWEETAVLPVYKHVIVDEGHHIQEVATEYFGIRLSQIRIRRLLSLFYRARATDNRGVLPTLRQRLNGLSNNQPGNDLIALIDWQLIPQIRKIEETTTSFFLALENYLVGTGSKEAFLRIPHRQGIVDDQVLATYDQLHRTWIEWERQLRACLGLLEEAEDTLDDKIGPASGFRPFIERVENTRADLEFLMDVSDKGYVYWLGLLPKQRGAMLQAAPIDVGPSLRENMLFPLSSVVFTSATLTVDDTFDYYRGCIGLVQSENWQLTTLVFPSPFQYQNQVYLGVPMDSPTPDQRDFIPYLASSLKELLPLTAGKTFVLFTSYAMLDKVVQSLRKDGVGNEYNLIVQGELSRPKMIEQFRTKPKSVLFGTDSFWEGVDVAGDALSSVIMTKLPFRVPSDPIVAARAERIQAEGGNPFYHYFLPQAVIKFRQGCGRLIRTTTDRGLLLICDRRLVEKEYGQYFLGSLPSCQLHKGRLEHLHQEVERWLLLSEH